MAVVRLGTNNVRSAQAYLKEAIRIETNYPPALYNLAWLTYYKRQVPSEAAPLYRQYLAVAEDRGREAKAQAILQKIETATPPRKRAVPTPDRRPATPGQRR
jgi:tetratricopeptide (TPR) repeat protein